MTRCGKKARCSSILVISGQSSHQRTPNSQGNRSFFEESKTAFASSISLYEVDKLSISHEDRALAGLRVGSIKKEFRIIDVDPEIAEEEARISRRVKAPMADGLIMATARKLRVPCATDDSYFTEVKRIWV